MNTFGQKIYIILNRGFIEYVALKQFSDKYVDWNSKFNVTDKMNNLNYMENLSRLRIKCRVRTSFERKHLKEILREQKYIRKISEGEENVIDNNELIRKVKESYIEDYKLIFNIKDNEGQN